MKRELLSIGLLATSLFASSVSYKDGWNLLGSLGDLNPQTIQCAKSVWTWSDGKWKLYQIMNKNDNYGFDVLNSISKGQGFWLDASCSNIINFNDENNQNNNTDFSYTDSFFSAFGYDWVNRQYSAEYTEGNSIITTDDGKVLMTANKKTGGYSRVAMRLYSPMVKIVEAKVKLDIAKTGNNQLRLLASSGANVTDDYKNAQGFSQNHLYAGAYIEIQNNQINVYYTLEDPTDPNSWRKIYSKQLISYDSPSLIGKDLNIKITKDGSSINFYAENSELNLNVHGSYSIPSDVLSGDIGMMRIGTRVKDAQETGDVTKAEILDFKANKYDITTRVVSSVVWGNISSAYDFESGDDGWFSQWSKTKNSMVFTDYSYDNGAWQEEDKRTMNIESQTDKTLKISAASGEKYQADILKTVAIESINGQNLSNVYLSDIKITSFQSDGGDVNYWGWAPRYHEDNQEKIVTSNSELKKMFLINDSWFDDQNHAMLRGDINDISGDVVKGVADGYRFDENDKRYELIYKKSDIVIGSWSLNSNGEIKADLPTKTEIFSIVPSTTSSDCSSDTGYCIKDIETDKSGSHIEYILTGSGVTEDILKTLME